MASPLSATRLVSVLDEWAVTYKLYPGWTTRTRPGGVTPNGFVIHHTGGPYTHSDSYLTFLFETGRPDEGIPGPLCNFAIDDLGVCHVGSIGRTNNAGPGYLKTKEHVIAEDYPGYVSELDPGLDNYNNGNEFYWGVEIMYPGTLAMKPAQRETAVLLSAALMDGYGWTGLSTIAHREHTSRKWDPGQLNLATFRRDIKDRLAEGADVPLSDADVVKNWSQDGIVDPPDSLTTPTNPTWAPKSALKELLVGRVHLEDANKVLTAKVNTLQTDVTALKAAVAAIPGGATDVDAIATAVAAKLAESLELQFTPKD
jgi:hypothetical protein